MQQHLNTMRKKKHLSPSVCALNILACHTFYSVTLHGFKHLLLLFLSLLMLSLLFAIATTNNFPLFIRITFLRTEEVCKRESYECYGTRNRNSMKWVN